MSAKKYFTMIDSACQNNDATGLYQAFYDKQIGKCHHPRRIKIKDPVSGKERFMYVPCGKCYNCLETKRNEWVSRFYAQTEDSRYCYFITLTYAPVERLDPVGSFMIDYLRDAAWIYDDHNTFHVKSWNPCLLSKSHYQNFFKRLRKALPDNNLIYYIAGEYGHDYGRPHYHIILFSDRMVSRSDIEAAWSIRCSFKKDKSGKLRVSKTTRQNNSTLVPFGNVDFVPLFGDGHFLCESVSVDGNDMDPTGVFKYVTKYVTKVDYNSFRPSLFYASAFGCEERDYKSLLERGESLYARFCTRTGTTEHRLCIVGPGRDLEISEMDFMRNSHEKVFCRPFFEYDDKYKKVKYNYELQYDKFLQQAAPFHECSRAEAIGSRYIERNAGSYSEGNYAAPALMQNNAAFVCPRYFIRKVSEYLFSLDQLSYTARKRQEFLESTGKSAKDYSFLPQSASSAYSRGDLLKLYQALSSEDFHELFDVFGFVYTPDVIDYKLAVRKGHCLQNKFDKCYYLLVHDPDGSVDDINSYSVQVFSYFKTLRGYRNTSTLSLSDFVDQQMPKIGRLFRHYSKVFSRIDDEEYYDNLIKDTVNAYFADFDTLPKQMQLELLSVQTGFDSEKFSRILSMCDSPYEVFRSMICADIVQSASEYAELKHNLHRIKDRL